jgi:hypothetical protein
VRTQRLENVGIGVEDLAAATSSLVGPGLTALGEGPVEGVAGSDLGARLR